MKPGNVAVSVVMPAYNAASWLPKSIPKIVTALANANIDKAEFIIVDDGSTDDTAEVANSLKLPYPLRVISHSNQGRFLARKLGTSEAKFPFILFIDTRVFIDKGSLKYVIKRMGEKGGRLVWCGHVNAAKEGNIYARFWQAIVFVAWRKYFANPRDCSYGLKDFDRYPKGTTCFFVPKQVIAEANTWFLKETKDLRTSNDDTLLIRYIAGTHPINLSPGFSCTYHARSSLIQFVRHVHHRGKVFVDGFLRRDGNLFFWPLVAFLALSAAIIPLLIIFHGFILPFLGLLAVAWMLELLLALVLGVPAKDALSLFVLSPIFTVFYGLGIWSAAVKIYILRDGRKTLKI